MSLDSPDQEKKNPSRTSILKFFKSYSFMIPTLVIVSLAFFSGTWRLALFINDKQKERREQTLHITQDISVTTGDLTKGKIPISVQFKITNTGKSTAYILPGGFKLEGINFEGKQEGQKEDDFKTLLEKIESRDRSLLYHDASLMDDSHSRAKELIAAGALFVGSTRMHYRKDDGTAMIYEPKEPARKFEHNESAQENFLFFVKPGDYEYIIFVGIIPFVSQQGQIWSRIEFDIDNSFVNVIPCYAAGPKGDQCSEDINAEEGDGREFLDGYTFTPVITFKYISLKN